MLDLTRLRLAASSLALMTALLAAPAWAQDTPAPAAPASAEAAPAPAKPLPPETVLAKVGSQVITEADLQAASADLASQFGQLPPEQQRLAVLSALIDIKALAEKAEAAKLQDQPDVARRIAFLRERALHNAYFEKEGVAAITDAELKARYDAEVAAMKPVEEIHAKHILVPTKEEAEAAIKELDAGKDFDAVAAEKSTGPTGPQGGDLGFFGPGQMVPPFEEAAFKLEPGTYTKEPVQTQFGWHVIKVLEKRKQQPPAFDQVKDQVRQIVMREKYIAMVQAAREAEKVTYEDPALKAQVEAMEKTMSGAAAADPEEAADEADQATPDAAAKPAN
ncbi:peptidylprolyl isomerase [Aureimonas ureilytica]|uniref:Parvulin-like PPIase n=1 Tax=Aureimonas ureilytica TaxID=401562 RepID=A0A175R923_9HYPH|nr:peptidyl-prolyl cis-trans isomerase [Aureimonas ureilytica]KTQ95733.1 peptidylprolyl isomerase [Aureimonas ureilytica]